MKNILKYGLLAWLLAVLIFNICKYIGINKKNTVRTHEEFIIKNTGFEMDNSAKYNLYFFITPIDCKCLGHIKSREFVENIYKIKNNGIVKVNYVVSGDYDHDHLYGYVKNIKDIINQIYIDRNNNVKMYLFKEFGTLRTPFLLILDSNGKVKYWQYFDSSLPVNELANVFYHLLEAIQ